MTRANRFVSATIGVVLAMLVSFAVGLKYWASMWLKGHHLWWFLVAFVPLAIIGLVWACAQRRPPWPPSTREVATCAIRGAIAGYFAGLGGYVALTLCMSDGLARLEKSATSVGGWVVFLGFPLLIGSWAFGAIAGALAVAVQAWSGRSSNRGGRAFHPD